jgi:dTDP-4-dehydrorhamnose 3,5-epimerase
MKVTETSLAGVLLIDPQVFREDRGFFLKSYQRDRMAELGIAETFVQDNQRARFLK